MFLKGLTNVYPDARHGATVVTNIVKKSLLKYSSPRYFSWELSRVYTRFHEHCLCHCGDLRANRKNFYFYKINILQLHRKTVQNLVRIGRNLGLNESICFCLSLIKKSVTLYLSLIVYPQHLILILTEN